MMATEPAANKIAEVSVPHQLSNRPKTTQNGDDYSTLNGSVLSIEDIANKRITSVEEQLQSTDVSVSGGSDTEASRVKDGNKSHSRTGSAVRKPATFKAVSVNKTFLAAKANNSNMASKTTERSAGGSSTPPPGPSALSASRPRLVAKSGGAARDSVPRFSSVNGAKAVSAPDGSAVWNKNRPPEPKKLTDEELKKYGIHMASRLNEDDAQGQSKWADDDEDDDDWAPDAITWGDGTKTKLPHPDEQPPVHEIAQPPSKDRFQPPTQIAQPEYSAPKAVGLPSGKGIVLKGATQERPALVAKPPQPPAPVKSPWAQLPPVDRPQQPWNESTGSPRGSYKEPPTMKIMSNHPPKEVAADDFSRSPWKDSHGSGGRELYNSHSGRFEPVPERYGPVHSEHPGRQPLVLQRQPVDKPEPSSAFQTNRNSQEGPYSRRRASSNLSGGSGTIFSRGVRGNEGPQQNHFEEHGHRRPSFSGSNEAHFTHHNAVAAHGPQHRQQPSGWQGRPPSGANFVAPNRNSDSPDGSSLAQKAPGDDDVEFQKKLMKERIELARKRRQEEEEREEAARKERIQKKLEALGPAPEKKPDKKEVMTRDETKPVQIQRRDGPLATDAQPPQAVASSSTDVNTRKTPQNTESTVAEAWGGTSPRPDRMSVWGTGPNQPGRNVWGSPDNDRGLGNGTFNPDLGRIPGSGASAIQSTNAPQPIPLPVVMQSAPVSSRASRYEAGGSELANKWVAAVADNDRKLSAARLADRTNKERQLAERGLSSSDAQPVIKETWRQVHAPGDGTRQVMNAADLQLHGPGPWKPSQDDKRPIQKPNNVTSAGVIGSGAPPVLAQSSISASQTRTSRFFPARETRLEPVSDTARPSSPSLPPPTMEGHPVYEGDAKHPQVSLPKPQPVVKLPPALSQSSAQSSRQQNAWSYKFGPNSDRGPQPYGHISQKSAESSQEHWQGRINDLLHKGSPPRPAMGMDVSSRCGYEHAGGGREATVALPGNAHGRGEVAFVQIFSESKPMAEELCFEEQEFGSLPLIRIPRTIPDAPWQAVTVQFKPLPKRLAVEACVMEPFYISSEHAGNPAIVRIQLPGMQTLKTMTFSQVGSSGRGGRGGPNRAPPRHRGGGSGSKSGEAGQKNPFPSTTSGRGGRGGRYRGRGGDNWNRNKTPPSSTQTPLST